MSERKAKPRQVDVREEHDVWLAVGAVVAAARELEIVEADRVRLETVISEMAHNVLLHGGGGFIVVESANEPGRCGLRIRAQDEGPGIRDISLALQDGYTTSDTLGIGMGVTFRLMDDVAIRSYPEWGTIVIVTKWLGNGSAESTEQDAKEHKTATRKQFA
jgi:serine/threonine-protein kinase RsbT